MTTTTAPEQQEQAQTKVDLTAANGSAPKRRGRPPGSKNKPKTDTTPTRRTRRSAAPMTTPTAAPAKATGKTVDITAHAVLIENGSVNVLLSDGTSFKIDGPVFDRR